MFRKITLTLIPGVAMFSVLALVTPSTRVGSPTRGSIRTTTTIAARSGYIVASS